MIKKLNINKNKYIEYDYILKYINDNPIWISAFTSGEGSFLGSLIIDIDSRWGVCPQCEFNITQSFNDKQLLEAINSNFCNTGGVYLKNNNIGAVQFRKITVLKNIIIPFFDKYPLLGCKNFEFNNWKKLVDILYNKHHVGKNIDSKNYILEFAIICKKLNKRRINTQKQTRIDIIIEWLKLLDNIPIKNKKLELKNKIYKAIN